VNPPNCGVGPTGTPSVPLDGLNVAYASDNTDWRIALSHDLGDATMIYVQAATGYKAGGNNARPFFPSQSHAFLPETLDSFEVGVKSTLGGNTRLNAAVFSNSYDDIQLPTNVCYWAPVNEHTPCASQDNIGDADVWGFEVEAEWHPTDQFSLDAAYGFLDFEYSRVNPISPVTLTMVSPYTPESKASVGLQYAFNMGGGGTLTPRLDVAYTDEVFSNAVNAATNRIDGYTLVNARLTWRSMSDDWQIALEATNLTDEYYYVTLFDLSNAAAGYIHGQPSRPREVAMSVRRNF
jgi:iron complex outermembrane receptor protein